MKPTTHHVLEPFEGYWDSNPRYWDGVEWRSHSAQVRDPGRMTMRWPHGLVRKNSTNFWRARIRYNGGMVVLQWVNAPGDWRTMPGANIYMVSGVDED